MSASPASSSKRIKLESSPSLRLTDNPDTLNDEHLDHDHCVICLQSYADRTVIPTCSHEFCFECISLWAEQSQKCPLCSQLIGEYLIHRIRSQFDYQKHYLPPPRSKSPQFLPTGETRVRAARRARRERYWGRRDRDADQADQLERAIVKRRWVYQNHFYAKHVASNSFTRYRPYPTPAQFAASPDMISRATIFLRRELRVWPNLDVEFLTTFTISLMKSIDIRTESAVKLLAEFLDLDASYTEGQRHPNAEHFAHEIYSYIRSGRNLSTYDNLVQYDTSDVPLSYDQERESRWRHESRSRSRSSHRHRLRSRSRSRSPSSRPSSSALRAEYGRSPSTIHRRDSSSDNLTIDRIRRRQTRSVATEHRDIIDTSNNHQSRLDSVQQQSVNKSQRARGKERERDHTPPLLGGNEDYSSSVLPRGVSGRALPDSIVVPQPIAELRTFGGNTIPSTPLIESGPEHIFVPTASKGPISVPDGDDAGRTVSVSRQRLGPLGRPPRTLLESVQAHLSRNTVSRQDRRHTDARETDAVPSHLPTSTPHVSSHSCSHPPPSNTTTLLGTRTSAKESQGWQGLHTDPVTGSPIRETASGDIAVRTCSNTHPKSEDSDDRISASSPPPFVPVEPAPYQKPNANSNLISSPHNSNPNCIEMADHTQHVHQEAATYGNTNKAAVRSSSDLRRVLLQRLEDEQRVAQSSASTLDCSGAQGAVATPYGVEEVEARLRTRVLLRVRLAAIKSATNECVIEL